VFYTFRTEKKRKARTVSTLGYSPRDGPLFIFNSRYPHCFELFLPVSASPNPVTQRLKVAFLLKTVQNSMKRVTNGRITNSETGITREVGTRLKPGLNPLQRVLSPTVKRELKREDYAQQCPSPKEGGRTMRNSVPLSQRKEETMRNSILLPKERRNLCATVSLSLRYIQGVPSLPRVYTGCT